VRKKKDEERSRESKETTREVRRVRALERITGKVDEEPVVLGGLL